MSGFERRSWPAPSEARQRMASGTTGLLEELLKDPTA